MSKVMVFNFETMQYEQVSEAEGKEWVGLIESMNTDYAAQHRVQSDLLSEPACCASFVLNGIHHRNCRWARTANR